MDGKLYYSFKAPKQDVRFIALESTYMEPEQVKWIEEDAAAVGARRVEDRLLPPSALLVGRDARLRRGLRGVLEPLFIKYGVSVVLTGHDHFYERTKPQQGITYFVAGSGGQLREGEDPQRAGLLGGHRRQRQRLSGHRDQGDAIVFNAIATGGKVVDSGRIERVKKAESSATPPGAAGGGPVRLRLAAVVLSVASTACAARVGASGQDRRRGGAARRHRAGARSGRRRRVPRHGHPSPDRRARGRSRATRRWIARYVDRASAGNTPKFYCRLADGRGSEGQVRTPQRRGLRRGGGDAAAVGARLRRRCACTRSASGAPGVAEEPGAPPLRGVVTTFDAAVIERKMPGRSLKGKDGEGWTWKELDAVDPSRGGATLAQRDALKLLAAMIQHTDSKRDQQSLICADEASSARACRRPWMLIGDLGKTFGQANAFNRDAPGSVNLEAWAEHAGLGRRRGLPRQPGAVGDRDAREPGRHRRGPALPRLAAAPADRPPAARLFAVARFPERSEARKDADGRDIAAWVSTFKDKVAQMADRSCRVAGNAP